MIRQAVQVRKADQTAATSEEEDMELPAEDAVFDETTDEASVVKDMGDDDELSLTSEKVKVGIQGEIRR